MAESCARRTGSQRGETLIESLISLMLLSVVAASALIGLQMAIRASAMHHQLAVAETLLRSAAEDLQNPDSPYIPLAGCQHNSTYEGLPDRPGYSPIQVEVRFWIPSTTPDDAATSTDFAPLGTCPPKDPGLQEIRLRLVTPAGHIQKLNITKRAR